MGRAREGSPVNHKSPVINKNKINTNATKLLRDKLKKNIKKTKLTPEATPVVGNSKPPLFN